MRVNKWGVGFVLVATALLSGCSASGSDTAPDGEAGTGTTGADASQTDCPTLEEGATVAGEILGACITEAMEDTAGFAISMSTFGMESSSRYNPADLASETTTSFGSIIIIDDQTWVKPPTGEWQVADASSADQDVLALSSASESIDPADPLGVAGALSGDFTVTGTDSRLGEEVFLVEGVTTSGDVSVSMVFELTSDFVALAASASTEVEGQKLEAVQEVTEWDVKQDIVAPL